MAIQSAYERLQSRMAGQSSAGGSSAMDRLNSRLGIAPPKTVDYAARTQKSILNATNRLNAIGQPLPEPKKGVLGSILDNLMRTGYGVNNVVDEFISQGKSGSTPSTFDPLKAFGRGFTLQDRTTGKDLAKSIGVSDKAMFNLGGWKPTWAGAAGFIWDIVNPGDPLNWIAPGLGKAATSGVKGAEALTKAFGKETGEALLKLYTKSDGTTVKALDKLGANSVGKLTEQVMRDVYKMTRAGHLPKGTPDIVKRQIKEALEKNGVNASTKLDFKTKQALAANIVNPVTGNTLKKIEIAGTSAPVGSAIDFMRKLGNTPVINDLRTKFSNKVAPSAIANSTILKKISNGMNSIENMHDATTAMKMLQQAKIDVDLPTPMSVGQVKKLQEIIEQPKTFKEMLDSLNYSPHAIDTIEVSLKDLNQQDILIDDIHTLADKIDQALPMMFNKTDAYKIAVLKKTEAFHNYNAVPDGFESLWSKVDDMLASDPDSIKNMNTRMLLEDLSEQYINRISEALQSIPKDLQATAGKEVYAELYSQYMTSLHRIMANANKWEREVTKLFSGIDDEGRKKIAEIASMVSSKENIPEQVSDEYAAFLSQNPQAVKALEKFIDWRQEIIEGYKKRGIQTGEIEKYVPFIPERQLKADEAALVKSLFREDTDVTDFKLGTTNDLMDMVQSLDPNIKSRKTQAISPKEVNKLLGKEWLSEDAAVMMAVRGTRGIRAQETYDFMKQVIDSYGFTPAQAKASGITTQAGKFTPYVVKADPSGKQYFAVATPEEFAEQEARILLMPTEIAETFNRYMNNIFDPTAHSAFGRLFDSLTGEFKRTAYLRNPGHIPRDFTGNVFNLWLMGITTPKPYMDAMKMLLRPDQFKMTIKGVEYTGEMIMKEAADRGILGFSGGVVEGMKSFKKQGKTSVIQKYDDLMRTGTKKVDNLTRLGGYLYNLSKGMDFDQAAVETKKYVFDYFDLTDFEKKVMKRIIPFYTWMRKNIPLQAYTLVTKPQKYRDIAWAGASLEGGETGWDEKPEYIRDMGALRVPTDGGGIFINPNLPYTDLARLPFSQNEASNLIASINPFLRLPLIEWPTNTKLFSNRPIADSNLSQTPVPFSGLLKAMGVLDKANLSPEDIPQNPVVGVNSEGVPTWNQKYLDYMFQQIPFLRNIDVMTNPENERQIPRMSTFIGGPSYFSAESVERSMNQETLMRLTELISYLEDQGIEVPTTKDLEKAGYEPHGGDTAYGRLMRRLGQSSM